MTVKEAIKLLNENFPGRKATGYWEQDGNIILNTKAYGDLKYSIMPGQFMVTKDGQVYGTNPMMCNLDPNKMKKL